MSIFRYCEYVSRNGWWRSCWSYAQDHILNREWQYALMMFEEGKYLVGIQHLIKQRQLWIDRPDLLIRAARHYDGKIG